jgi:hypothetical protein
MINLPSVDKEFVLQTCSSIGRSSSPAQSRAHRNACGGNFEASDNADRWAHLLSGSYSLGATLGRITLASVI